MRTIQNNSSSGEYTLWQRTKRNLSLMLRMAFMLYAYFIAGRKVRRAYREKAARGEIFYVDEDMPR